MSTSIVAARTRLPCGCATWLEWDDGQDAWIAQRFTCSRHAGGGPQTGTKAST